MSQHIHNNCYLGVEKTICAKHFAQKCWITSPEMHIFWKEELFASFQLFVCENFDNYFLKKLQHIHSTCWFIVLKTVCAKANILNFVLPSCAQNIKMNSLEMRVSSQEELLESFHFLCVKALTNASSRNDNVSTIFVALVWKNDLRKKQYPQFCVAKLRVKY